MLVLKDHETTRIAIPIGEVVSLRVGYHIRIEDAPLVATGQSPDRND